jgi:hypothetical protein
LRFVVTFALSIRKPAVSTVTTSTPATMPVAIGGVTLRPRLASSRGRRLTALIG